MRQFHALKRNAANEISFLWGKMHSRKKKLIFTAENKRSRRKIPRLFNYNFFDFEEKETAIANR